MSSDIWKLAINSTWLQGEKQLCDTVCRQQRLQMWFSENKSCPNLSSFHFFPKKRNTAALVIVSSHSSVLFHLFHHSLFSPGSSFVFSCFQVIWLLVCVMDLTLPSLWYKLKCYCRHQTEPRNHNCNYLTAYFKFKKKVMYLNILWLMAIWLQIWVSAFRIMLTITITARLCCWVFADTVFRNAFFPFWENTASSRREFELYLDQLLASA